MIRLLLSLVFSLIPVSIIAILPEASRKIDRNYGFNEDIFYILLICIYIIFLFLFYIVFQNVPTLKQFLMKLSADTKDIIKAKND